MKIVPVDNVMNNIGKMIKDKKSISLKQIKNYVQYMREYGLDIKSGKKL